MPVIETTLAETYVPNWGLREGLREIGSNAIDGEMRDSRAHMEVEYLDGMLHVTNRNTTLGEEVLLMGMSESRANESCIGQFGEGLPLALLAITRAGRAMQIENGEYRWTPRVARSSTFGANVLQVQTRKLRVARRDLRISVQVTPEEYSEFCHGFLRMNPLYNESQRVSTVYGDVLLQSNLRGRIYAKGVFVMEDPKLLFGYNFSDIQLNRDRNFVSESTVQYHAGMTLRDAVDVGPDSFLDLLEQRVESFPDAQEMTDRWSNLGYSEKAQARFTKAFFDKYGPLSYPVTTATDALDAELCGKKAIVTSQLMRKLVVVQHTLEELKGMRSKAVTHRYTKDELTEEERTNLLVSVRLLRKVVPEHTSRVHVVDFAGDALSREEDAQLLVARHRLKRLDWTLREVLSLGHEPGDLLAKACAYLLTTRGDL